MPVEKFTRAHGDRKKPCGNMLGDTLQGRHGWETGKGVDLSLLSIIIGERDWWRVLFQQFERLRLRHVLQLVFVIDAHDVAEILAALGVLLLGVGCGGHA